MPAAPSGASVDLQAALSGVARAIAQSLELQDVFDRVAEACRSVVPFDGMAVARLLPGGSVRLHVTAGAPPEEAARLAAMVRPRSQFSERNWPTGDDFVVLVGDIKNELDPAFPVDVEIMARPFQSMMRLPVGRGAEKMGSLLLVSLEKDFFTVEHARSLSVVTDLLALALAHESLASRWRERGKRREALERLITTLTQTLDVREVFAQIAQIAHEIVPHDYVTIGLLSEDGRRVRIIANSGPGVNDVREIPEYPLPDELLHTTDWDYFLAREFTVVGPNTVRMELLNLPPLPPSIVDLQLDDFWMQVYTTMGVRSSLRATIRLNGAAVGGVDFSSREAGHFDDDDAEFAMRVADHVALALAHQELAEESRRTAAAQARASRLAQRVEVLVKELETLSPHRALGSSARWRDVLAQATKVAPTDTTVLLTGESGTGKEVVARFVHRASARKEGPFVALNCAALPEQLLESELFGHEKGAFTGALSQRAGRIEQAAGGVLFLDEVGEMSPAVQAKFLRVLQEREYQRLGGTRTLKAEVRVLAATNRDLRAAIRQGGFREDLYYRLAVFEIGLPALRERPEDVLVLAEAFLEEIGRSIGRPAAGASQEVRDKLVAYPWPGNVRELRNALERAIILCEGGLITSEHLPTGIASAAAAATAAAKPAFQTTAGGLDLPPPGSVTLDAAEREMVRQALSRTNNNQSQAARLLGLSRSQLRSRMEKHGLMPQG
jgi:transcriptional regulator with GAF, ATPase, and Fis domain